MRPRAGTDQRGFVLIELLFAAILVAVVMAGLSSLMTRGSQGYLAGANQVDAQSALRAALLRMTREIREAGYNPVGLPQCTPTPSPPTCLDVVINATDTGFTLQNDWNGKNGIEPAVSVASVLSWGTAQRGEQTTYSIVNGTLQRLESAVDGAPQPLASHVVQVGTGGAPLPYFQYLDAAGNVLATPIASPSLAQSQIRTVVVNLQLGSQQATLPTAAWGGGVGVVMSDRIRLRNR